MCAEVRAYIPTLPLFWFRKSIPVAPGNWFPYIHRVPRLQNEMLSQEESGKRQRGVGLEEDGFKKERVGGGHTLGQTEEGVKAQSVAMPGPGGRWSP